MADARTHGRRAGDRKWTPGRLAVVWGPPLVYLGLIFLGSSLTLKMPVAPPVSGLDKAVHFVEYGLLGLLLARGFEGSLRRPTFGRVLLLGAGLALLYGVTDEVHQAFVPGRDPDGWDLLADGIGGLVGAFLWALRARSSGVSQEDAPSPSAAVD